MHKALRVAVCAIMVSVIGVVAGFACKIDETAFQRTYRGDSTTATNLDLNDYGRIHVDAESATCVEGALYALYDKIKDSTKLDAAGAPVHPLAYKRWLDGYNVALIFAAAQRIGEQGWASKDLDAALDDVERLYELRYSDGTTTPPCSNEKLDTCMDDYAGAASGNAWIAAYKYRRGDSNVPTFQGRAEQYVRSAMAGVCIHNRAAFDAGNHRTLCNATVADLENGTAETMSLNHGQQTIAYGFGLMTSIASAIKGLEVSGMTFAWQPSERTIARELFEEAERFVDAGSQFKDICAHPVIQPDGTWVITDNIACGESYKPNMYALYDFYYKYLGSSSIPQVGTYRSNYFQASLFNDEFFSYGRQVTYGNHGYTWVPYKKSGSMDKFMPFDTTNPIGYFEQVGPTGLAQGWACDSDKPSNRIKVDLYDQYGRKYETWASSDSVQPEINQLCGGGTAHRFWLQLPGSSKGKIIRAYGLDYTWFGSTLLPCLQSPQCSW